MILDGECKKDFLEWYFNTYLEKNKFCLIKDVEVFFSSIELVIQNALIIDFFDSAGIYINISVTYGFNWSIDNYGGDDYNNRCEAIEQAIIKANNIYNEK